MSALYRNAWLDDEDLCLRCSTAVQLPADYCAACAIAMETGTAETSGSVGAADDSAAIAQPTARITPKESGS